MIRRRFRILLSIVTALAVGLGIARYGGLTTSPPSPGERAQSAVRAFEDRQAARPAEQYLVEVTSARESDELPSALQSLAAEETADLGGNWHAIELQDGQTEAELKSDLAAQGIAVSSIEADQPREMMGDPTLAPQFASQWALHDKADHDLNAPEAWSLTQGAEGIKIAVIDSGVDASHPDLQGVVLPGATFNGTASAATTDGNGHGTAIAGVIAAQGRSGVSGLAPGVRILPVKVFENGDGSGQFSMANYVAGIDWAVTNGARIINLSVGCPQAQPACFSQAEHDALDRARAAGVLVVASAGNHSRNNDALPDYPSGYDLPNIIAVGAADRSLGLASFSQYGPTSVDIAAPGVEIRSATKAGQWSSWSGTSFSAPYAAAAAALTLATDPALDPAALRARIMATARPEASLNGKVVSGGVVDAYASVLGRRPSSTTPALGGGGVGAASLVQPSNNAHASPRPTLRWRVPSGQRLLAVQLNPGKSIIESRSMGWVPTSAKQSKATSWSPKTILKPGRYAWRVETGTASRAAADTGKVSETRTFIVKPAAAVSLSRKSVKILPGNHRVSVTGRLVGNLVKSKLTITVRYRGKIIGRTTKSVSTTTLSPYAFTEAIKLNRTVPKRAKLVVTVSQSGSGSTARATASAKAR